MSDSALPLGMLFFASMVFGLLRRKTGHRLAASQYPALAQRLGLMYRPSAYRTGIGVLQGDYGGFSVAVDPDEQRSIRVRFETAPAVDLRTYERDTGPPRSFRTVFTRDKRFDGFFKTRWAGEGEARLLESIERPSAMIASFRTLRQAKSLSITAAGITCVFDYGNPPYIPAQVVEEFLPAMVRLARVFESPQDAKEPGRSVASTAEAARSLAGRT